MPETDRPLTWDEVNNRGAWEQVHASHASWEDVHPGGADAYAAEHARAPEEG